MIRTYQEWIESEIQKQPFGTRPKSLYKPLRYVMNLGGKRLRPMLALLSYSLFKSDPRSILPFAVAIESFHNFTLLHDDIMDNAPVRRNKPTVHQKWNVNTAILAGDVLQVKVFESLLEVEPAKLKEVLLAFTKCAIGVCEGQQWDMEFESKSKVTEGEYIEMITLKTAVLLGFSLQLGAILAGATEADQKAVYDFGVKIGIGFQLKDDLLDVYGDKKKFGKQVGGDIIANKKTFLLIRALQQAKGKNKVVLNKWLNAKKFNSRKKIKEVRVIYDQLEIQRSTEERIGKYFGLAFESLKRLSVPSEKKKDLEVFTHQLIERQT
jgi:geranylgeranyl diphosphate synthase, type II